MHADTASYLCGNRGLDQVAEPVHAKMGLRSRLAVQSTLPPGSSTRARTIMIRDINRTMSSFVLTSGITVPHSIDRQRKSKWQI